MHEGLKNERRDDHEFSRVEMMALEKKTGQVNAAHSLNMEQFIDTFGINKVKADYAEVAERMKSHLEKPMTQSEKLGHIFEAAFLDSATRHEWFGERSEVAKASKYDDVMNGIDMITTVVDGNDNARHFEVASDLTISNAGVASKFNRIVTDIHRGKLATIDYFHSDLLDMTGQLRNVPRTVIALDRHNIGRFLQNWLREPELAQEQMARLMISQIGTQAAGFANYAQNIHGSDSRMYRRYKSTYETAQELLETGDQFDLPEDESTAAIASLSDRVGRQSD